jgi:hypothetical protein
MLSLSAFVSERLLAQLAVTLAESPYPTATGSGHLLAYPFTLGGKGELN